MNDLLFYLLIMAGLYYGWNYLPQAEGNQPLKHTTSTQTENLNSDNQELTQALTSLLQNLQAFNQTI